MQEKFKILINFDLKLFMFSPTPALSYDQDFKKGTNKRLVYYWPPCHTHTGNYCQNLKRLRKKCFFGTFFTWKVYFSVLKHPFFLDSLWYFHRCVPGEILTYFDPPNLSVGPKLMFSKLENMKKVVFRKWLFWNYKSVFHQEHNCNNIQVKQDKIYAVKKVPKTFFSQSFEVSTIVPSTGMARGSIIYWRHFKNIKLLRKTFEQ